MSIFLSKEDVAELTGHKRNDAQVDMLRTMGIQFYINASGRPIVPKSAIEGLKQDLKQTQSWEPAVLKQNVRKAT